MTFLDAERAFSRGFLWFLLQFCHRFSGVSAGIFGFHWQPDFSREWSFSWKSWGLAGMQAWQLLF
jgi:hypothetical protein